VLTSDDGNLQQSKLVLQHALQSGMEGLNQAEVGSALQVLFNLHELQQVRFTRKARHTTPLP
jgi:hypothetical protein